MYEKADYYESMAAKVRQKTVTKEKLTRLNKAIQCTKANRSQPK